MVNFNMIDTVGRGIKKIYTEQRNRFFPMPDYDIDNEHRTVGVTIHGKMIDEKYTNLLKSNQSLSLKECLWLDTIQKHHPITKDAAKHLLDKGLIEGRAPHYTISLKVAKLTNQIGHYTKEKGLAENSIQKLLLQLAHNAGKMGFWRRDAFESAAIALFTTISPTMFLPSLSTCRHLRYRSSLLATVQFFLYVFPRIRRKISSEIGEMEKKCFSPSFLMVWGLTVSPECCASAGRQKRLARSRHIINNFFAVITFLLILLREYNANP